jgi:hypothetical protein
VKTALASLALLAALPAFAQHQHHDHQQQAAVAARGAEVMPFDLAATTHVFTKTPSGGIQRVVAKRSDDAAQAALVRRHLRDIEQQFRRGDFSGPSHIHGAAMPGLAQLKAARPGQVAITYREVPAGAELEYRSQDAQLVTALHQWFDAQLADHGADARPGNPG